LLDKKQTAQWRFWWGGGTESIAPSTKKESGGEPLSGALRVLCKEHFGLAFQVGGKPLLHFFGRRFGFAIDHSGMISSIM
jgi:hypothetical protein